MAFSVNDYLNVVKPHLPRALFSTEALAHIQAVAHQIPGMTTTFFGFECRLGTAAAKADFLLRARQHEPGPMILAGQDADWDLPKEFFSHPVWHRIRTFCKTWANPASSLYANVQNTWLEFDLDDPAPDIPVPSFFFGTRNTLAAAVPVDQHRWVTDHALGHLFDPPLPDAVQRQLLTCVNALPDKAYVFQIGAMLARRTQAVRVCIRDIAPDLLLTYLTQIAWPGSVQALAPLLADFTELVDWIHLDVDIGNTVFPNVGLECYLKRQPNLDPRWPVFLDHLVERGLCLSEKRDALLQYPGHDHERADPNRWPAHLLNVSERMGPHKVSIISRTINHIKVVYRPGQPLEAKAYLSVGHHWVDTRGLELARIAKFLLSDSPPKRTPQALEAARIRDYFLGHSSPMHTRSETSSYNRLLVQAISAYRVGSSKMFPMFLSDSHVLYRDTFQAQVKVQLSKGEHKVYAEIRDTTLRGGSIGPAGLAGGSGTEFPAGRYRLGCTSTLRTGSTVWGILSGTSTSLCGNPFERLGAGPGTSAQGHGNQSGARDAV